MCDRKEKRTGPDGERQKRTGRESRDQDKRKKRQDRFLVRRNRIRCDGMVKTA